MPDEVFDNKKKYFFWEKYYPLIITVLFLSISIILIYNHELWFDETHAWLKASRSGSIPELVVAVRNFEGTPFMWHFILYFISHSISSNIESMKVIHLAFSTVSVFLILKYFPINRIYKTLMVFGYFLFFEYSIISRNYNIGVLFLIIFCVLYKNKYKNLLFLGVTLFFLGQANYYSFIISMALALLLIIDFIIDYKRLEGKRYKIYFTLVILIIILEIALFYWQLNSQAVKTLPDFTGVSSFNDLIGKYYNNILGVLNGIFIAFIPISKIHINFFNNSIISNLTVASNLRYLFPISFILIFTPIFIIKRRYIIPYIAGLAGIIIMPLLVYKGYFRHYGHIFLLFIAVLWISSLEKDGNSYLIKKSKKTTIVIFHTLMIIILLSSLSGAAIASYFDFKYPFSNAKYVSDYIEDNYELEDIALAGYWDRSAVAVSAYLGKDPYCPQEGEVISFVPWNSPKRLRDLSDEEIFSDVIKLLKRNDKIILMLDHRPDPLISDKYKFEEVASFEKSITGQEDYYIYEWNRESFIAVYSSDMSNFTDFWVPINNCSFVLTKDEVIVKATENDPYFESIFPMKFYKGEYIVINVVMSPDENSFLQVYYGREGKHYNESDSDKQEVLRGDNNIFIIIPDPENIERLRIDPVQTGQNSIIKKIDILKLN